MKRTSNKLFLYSLTSLAVIASSAAVAHTRATAPTLEGGLTASIGTFYVAPSADGQEYAVLVTANGEYQTIDETILEVNPDYDFGFEAALGYIFEDTANGVELLYRTIHTNDSDSILDPAIYIPVLADTNFQAGFDRASSTLEYDLNAVDLMFSQFMDIGTHVQMRFLAGISYVNLEKEQNSLYSETFEEGSFAYHNESQFSGIGPRLGADARYDFGQGFGILGGASLAYYMGDVEVNDQFTSYQVNTVEDVNDDIDSHGVTNLRANVAIDYVYFYDNEERSTVGVELGYLVDYYADAIQQLGYNANSAFIIDGSAKAAEPSPFPLYDGTSDTNSLAFSGPYLNIKAAF